MTVTREPSTPAAPPPSFLRRHPILAGFGILAGLSLFASYWPLSAILTGIVVAGRATGVDEVALNAARRGVSAVASRLRHATPSQPAHSAAPTVHPPAPPGAPSNSVAGRERTLAAHRPVAHARRSPAIRRTRRGAEASEPSERGLGV